MAPRLLIPWLLVMSLGLVGACGGAEEAKPVTADAGKAQYGKNIRFLNGTVTGHAESLFGTGKLEINGTMYYLASVSTKFISEKNSWVSCGTYSNHEGEKALSEALKTLAPVGTPVVAVRDSYKNALFVHLNPPNAGPTLNEQVLRAGLADGNSLWKSDTSVFPEAKMYFTAADEANVKAAESKAGIWGACERGEEEWQAEKARSAAEFEQSQRGAGAAGSGVVDVDVDWGDGYCDTCRAVRSVWRLFN